MGSLKTWRVVCQNDDCKQKYDQKAERKPHCCGVCGSELIAVMEHPMITPQSEAEFWAANPYAN